MTSSPVGPQHLEAGARPLEATFVPNGDPPTRAQGMLRLYGDKTWPWAIRQWLSQDDDALVEDGAVEELTAFLKTVGPAWDAHAFGSRGMTVKAWGPDEKLAMLCWLVCAIGEGKGKTSGPSTSHEHP